MLGLALKTSLEPQQLQWLTLADRSARDLLAIVNDILDFSKLETGRLSIEPVDFHLGELIDSLAALFAPRAAAQGDRLNWTIDPALPAWLRADDGRLRQVLLNLVGNAIKFTRDGRIDIRFAWMGAEDSGMLQVEIVDSGSGIPPEKLGKLFQPFSQVDSSLSRAHDGTGLGLAICKRLVEALGGQIGVSSQVGRGSRFWFSMRCVPGMAQNREAGEPVAAIRPLRILVAEDNIINQALMRELLHGAGHYCDLVADGVEAVEMVQKFPYDIVLMDVQMPRLDGVAAARQIRALETRVRDIPIVALTANVLPSQRQSYLDAGMTYFLAKPVEATALFRLLAAQATRL
jgi:CheY-like chemotaxis protein